MLLVVVEDLLHGLDTRVLITLVVLASALLVPVKDLDRPRATESQPKGSEVKLRQTRS